MSISHLNTAAGAAILAMVTVLAAGCNKPDIPADAIVSVGSASLTESELHAVMPKGLNAADSAAFAKSYISTWISNRLVTEVALKNLPDTREIDRMTDEYRRNLIMWEYLRLKTAEDPSLAVSPDSVQAYYDAHKHDYTTSEPMVKGILVRVPAKSAHIADIRKLLHTPADPDKLEKATLRDSRIAYDYFGDRWIAWSQIKAIWPVGATEIRPQAGQRFEAEATDWVNLLLLTEVLPAGSQMPAEVAAPLITRRLEAHNRADVEQRLRADMLQNATSDGTIRFHKPDKD